jgi:pectin methylesterase-like acyl-CoA thioesterase
MTKKFKVLLSKVVAASLALSLFSFSNPSYGISVKADSSATFYDNFEDGNSKGWTIQKGSWAVKDDGTNKTYCKTNAAEARTKAGNLAWTNYAVQGKIKVDNFNGSNRAMLCGRYSDGSNYYAASLSNTNGGEVQLRKMFNGKDSILKSVTLPLTTATWYTVKLDMNASNLNVYVNDTLKLTATDTSLAAGAIGLVAYNATAQYDDITVTNNGIPPTPVTYSTPTLTPNTTAANVSSVTVTMDNFGNAPIKQYKFDDGAWQNYTSPVTVTKNCTVYAQGSDSNGNKSSTGKLVISNIGTAPVNYPTPTLTPNTTAANVSSVTVTIDNFGSATVKQYKIDNGAWQNYTAPVTITSNCTVSAQGSDSSGNKSSIGKLVVSNIGAAPIEVKEYDLFVSPSGNDSNKGTIDAPLKTLTYAASVVKPGYTIYLRGGVHKYSSTITLSRSGSENAKINIFAYSGETPVLDFSDFKPADEKTRFYARGITLTGDYYHLKGLEICNSPDNGLKLEGSNNVIEQCVFHHNGDSGLQIGLIKGAKNDGTLVSNNLILNCDSYRNSDPATKYENADGFACKLYPGKGNKFYGCRSFENCDDGWDFYMTTYPIVVENCWAWHNGDPSLWGFTSFNGDGNGFKLGGDGEAAPHIIKNCVAFDSPYGAMCGFNDNNNGTGLILYNCTAWACGKNFKLQTQAHVLKNCAAFDPKSGKNFNADLSTKATSVNNTWDLKNVTADYNDFISTDVNNAKAARQADGSLPNNGFAKLKADSDLIDKGVDVGIPFKGSAPDLGAYEYNGSVTPPVVVTYPNPTITPNTIAANASNVTVTIDNFGNAPVKQYKIDDGAWQNYSAPLTVTKNCTVYAQGSDTSGNKSSIASLVINNIGTAPQGNYNLVVAKDGSGNYKTVQEAINAVPDNNTAWYTIYIKNGTYNEVVTVPENKTFVKLIGESAASTIITFNYCKDTNPAKTTAGSATAFFIGNDFVAQNITFENAYDYNNSKNSNKQAVAGEPMGDRQSFINCRFTGYQDTLYVRSGRQYFKDCYICGHTDFIFGNGTAVFENCEIYSRYKSGASVSAASTLAATQYGLTFINCKLTADPTLKADTVWLGRPWHPSDVKVPVKSSAAFINCNLGAHIKTEGWTKMGSVNPSSERLIEYKNTGAGAVINSTRPQLSDSEAANYTTKNILKGNDNWDPTSVK